MKDTLKDCQACGEGRLHPNVSSHVIEYKGRSGAVPLHYSVCDSCGSELVGAKEARANKREVIAFKKSIDGILAGRKIKAIREFLGLGQQEAALVFGGGKVAFSKYENNDVTPSEAMSKLLQLAYEVPEARDWLLAKANIRKAAAELFRQTVFIGGNTNLRTVLENKRPKGVSYSVQIGSSYPRNRDIGALSFGWVEGGVSAWIVESDVSGVVNIASGASTERAGSCKNGDLFSDLDDCFVSVASSRRQVIGR